MHVHFCLCIDINVINLFYSHRTQSMYYHYFYIRSMGLDQWVDCDIPGDAREI